MGFWEELSFRVRRADFDAHNKALHNSRYGSQVFVPSAYNNGLYVPQSYHDMVASKARQHGLSHHLVQAHGGWTVDPSQRDEPVDERVQIEPMHVHRAYGDDPTAHTAFREYMLPHIKNNLQQDASLATLDSHNGHEFGHSGELSPFSIKTLRARLPIQKDPLNRDDKAYRSLLGNLGDLNGGFTHYSLPHESQLEVHSSNPETLGKSQDMIEKYMRDNHHLSGKYDVGNTHAYLHMPSVQSEPQQKTASIAKEKNLLGPIRNIIHALEEAAMAGDKFALEFIHRMGLDN